MSTQIPLVVALWSRAHFGGPKRLVVEDEPNLAVLAFDNRTDAVGVHRGPDYAAWKAAHGGKEPLVAFFNEVNYGGHAVVLAAGAYGRIMWAFQNTHVSSIWVNLSSRFEPNWPPEAGPPGPVSTIAPIPLVVELYEHDNFNGRRLVVVEDSSSITADFGPVFDNVVTSVRVKHGPDFTDGKVARLFRNPNYSGASPIELAPGDYPNIGTSHGFNDVLSSIKVR